MWHCHVLFLCKIVVYSTSVLYIIVAERGNYSWYISNFPPSLHVAVSNFLWLLYVTDNNNLLRFLCKLPIFIQNFNRIWIFSTEFQRSSQYQISQISIQLGQMWYIPKTDRWTDEQTGVTQLISTFYRDAKVPKKAYEIIVLSMGLFNLNFWPLGQFLQNCDASF
jgi:hypothetical protein